MPGERRELLVGRNPEQGSGLPYLLLIPVAGGDLVIKARETWPRTAKVYCHRVEGGWPAGVEVVERWPVRSCTRRGPAVDLVLARARENRSQLVLARARGREVIFWQSPRTVKQARPAVTVPSRRASGQVLEIVVDSRERYPWRFTRQQASTVRRALPAGDYAVQVDGVVVAAVERKSLPDLASSLLSGKLTYAMAELAALPRAAVVVEDRYSALFKLEHAPGGQVAEALAEAQARFPAVPVFFAETRPLAQEWTYRYLGAALTEHTGHQPAGLLTPTAASTTPAGPVKGGGGRPSRARRAGSAGAADAAHVADVRTWAQAAGHPVAARGRIAAAVLQAYTDAHTHP